MESYRAYNIINFTKNFPNGFNFAHFFGKKDMQTTSKIDPIDFIWL